ncbi:zinc ribbon domain-containing protein [Halosolutus halophilus]|uniref:zinc ribbon domain-containing protein n=1 Tax=Halosolutus halophilus TaxID=1552990 RepID=UPI0022350749|nr:zinc ribbon domain-containing protein [Halosolutus halophilus]
MVAPGQLYAAIVIVLLLFALGVGIRVLTRIFRDGLERQRKRQAGEMERYTEDEEYDRGPAALLNEDAAGRTRLTCRHCGAENDPAFRYCGHCAEPL